MKSGVLLVRNAAEADELAGQVPKLESGGVQVWSVDV